MAAYPPEDRVDHPDLQGPPTERLVPDTERTLPTSRNTVLILSFLSALLTIAGGIVAFPMDNENLGLILAAIGAVLGLIAIFMAYGDARTGMGTPIVATITAGIIALIIAMNTDAVEDEIEDAGDATLPGVTTAPATMPADPAEIIDPEPEDALPE